MYAFYKFIYFLFLNPLFLTILFLSPLLTSCSVYKSPDRKDFESSHSDFRVQNLKMIGCSANSVKDFATVTRLISYSETESQIIWEHQIDDQIIFESNNLKGIYCLYEEN